LEDLPAQSRCRDRVDRPVRATLWPGDPSSCQPATGHDQRDSNPTAQSIAGQVTDALPWDEAPSHLLRDRDGAFGPAYIRRIQAKRIRDHPTARRSLWQNGHVERVIGSIRRESLDHLIVFDEAQLRRGLKKLRFLLQSSSDASLVGQECAVFAAPAKARLHRRGTNSRRTPSSIHSSLGFD
jgi:hypothetical protein